MHNVKRVIISFLVVAISGPVLKSSYANKSASSLPVDDGEKKDVVTNVPLKEKRVTWFGDELFARRLTAQEVSSLDRFASGQTPTASNNDIAAINKQWSLNYWREKVKSPDFEGVVPPGYENDAEISLVLKSPVLQSRLYRRKMANRGIATAAVVVPVWYLYNWYTGGVKSGSSQQGALLDNKS